MPKFLSIHTLPPGAFTPERIKEIAATFRHEEVHGYRSFHSLAEGRIAWILDAPDKQSVEEWCQKVGLPLDGVTQLDLEGHVGILHDPTDPKAGQPIE